MDIHEPRYIIFQQSFNRTGNASEPLNEFPVKKAIPKNLRSSFTIVIETTVPWEQWKKDEMIG